MLINRKAVKAYALGLAHELRAQPFSRVSKADPHFKTEDQRQLESLECFQQLAAAVAKVKGGEPSEPHREIPPA